MAPKHLIYIPVTGVGVPGTKGDVWLKGRIEFFKQWTLQSLFHQTNKDFILWMSFRHQESRNPDVLQLRQDILDLGIKCIFTFYGLCYHDDKYGGTLLNKMKNVLRLVRQALRTKEYEGLKENIRMVFTDKNKTLPGRLQRSLYDLSLEVEHTDKVLVTRIDSDDLFEHEALGRIRSCAEELFPDAILCTDGYIYNTETGEMATWNPKTNPPFHTIRFKAGEFMDRDKHLLKMKGYKSHEDVPKLFTNVVYLPGGMYCVTTHAPKEHLSTTYNHPFKGQPVSSRLLEHFI